MGKEDKNKDNSLEIPKNKVKNKGKGNKRISGKTKKPSIKKILNPEYYHLSQKSRGLCIITILI